MTGSKSGSVVAAANSGNMGGVPAPGGTATPAPGGVPGAAIAFPPNAPLLFVLSGPSGVGKDSVVDQIRKTTSGLRVAVTCTTRRPRSDEIDGTHYHFRTEPEFEAMIAADELLEWARVYDRYYGVPKFELRNAALDCQDVVLKVDVRGAATVRRVIPQAVLIFLAPPSYQELIDRLAARRTEDATGLALRSETAHQEMETMRQFDYAVVNREGALDDSVRQIEAIFSAERCRVHPRVFTVV